MKKILISLMLFCAAVLPLSGCNTVQGFGQDVSAAGHTITDVSK